MRTSSEPGVKEYGHYDSLLRLARHAGGDCVALLIDLRGQLLGQSGIDAAGALSLATLLSLPAAASPLCHQGRSLFLLASETLHDEEGFPQARLLLLAPDERQLDETQQALLRDVLKLGEALFEHLRAPRRENERRLTLAVAGSGTGIWDRHVPSGEIHYSSAWKSLLGYADDEIGGRIEDAYTRVHPDDLGYVQATMRDHFEGRSESYEVEHRLQHKDGHYIWVCSRGKVVERDAAGNALRMLGTTTDITALREVAEQLRESVQLLTDLTNEIPGMVFQFRRLPDGTGTFPYVSAGVLDIYGVRPEQVRGDSSFLRQVIHPEDLAACLASLENSAARMQPWRHEYRVVIPERGVFWRQGNAHPKRLEDDSLIWHGFITDITERKRIEAELQLLATTDYLTQLPNRGHFMHLIEAELGRVQRCVERSAAILMCDIDHFKSINDRWGHAVGDEALRHFAGILARAIRRIDFAGRMGGEEFAVVLGDADIASAQTFAQRLQQQLADQPLMQAGQRIPLTISIGVATLEPADGNAGAALSRSDSALYRAKQNGRNRIECH
ncbi:diguanylate cyclase (GGDEF)-like protein/PAS domain S-box-containing protein [Pseudomonas nitritireducens]|uniref:Diguanylate cyclase (GGDEF)-like protein/PAS domain S-box-containing protein n=1 Tax=Pseudomonas nitroreducens TaxID=46680 RepID=A0A7W7KGV6_PSENT|nr:sensor domain-containing diguanylate cyclase [Pseudomonas nitritireducens]MBB4862556.1 diguanylate cyclase (GGDEF)-like protein/PAS domain S-box-containing protein [Pseudomonas nitritireducens]